MASDGQQRLLYAIARAHGLTRPERSQTVDLTNDQVGEAKLAMERGIDVFAAGGPIEDNSTRVTVPSAVWDDAVIRYTASGSGDSASTRIEIVHYGNDGQAQARIFTATGSIERADLAEALDAAADLLRGAA